MRRIMVILIAAFLVALLPAVALAQSSAELDALEEAVRDLDGETAEEWTEGSESVTEALDALRAAEADLDYAELDQAIADLDAAIEAGDQEAIAAAAAALAPAYDALAAQSAGGDDTAAPTAVATGDAVDGGPNVALLMVAGMLALLAVGAFALRRVTDRR
jgi:hypothetical protein